MRWRGWKKSKRAYVYMYINILHTLSVYTHPSVCTVSWWEFHTKVTINILSSWEELIFRKQSLAFTQFTVKHSLMYKVQIWSIEKRWNGHLPFSMNSTQYDHCPSSARVTGYCCLQHRCLVEHKYYIHEMLKLF